MRKYSFLFTLLLLSASSFAQNKDFSYKFYGQVRTDLYYNSRANEETVDGLFYMYPKDKGSYILSYTNWLAYNCACC